MSILRAAALSLLLGLTACASGPRIVSSRVSTETAQPPATRLLTQMHYRFEPVPAVAGQPAPQRLQEMAESALTRVGAVHDEAAPRMSVQVSGSVTPYWRDPDFEMSNPRVMIGIGGGWHHGGVGFAYGWPFWSTSVPDYASRVTLVIRDLSTGQIAYRTEAQHSGPWHDTDAVLNALFIAALQGYPAPPQGVRNVEVPLLQPAQEGAGGTAPEPVPKASD